ncbi:hypothetical protein Sjap_004802 [Stephania japonica]|uniref:Uncharacterized protein n=1 Tax=Stephania japonica TaxID=461633 RepID=A0AAP0K481_9MAGN
MARCNKFSKPMTTTVAMAAAAAVLATLVMSMSEVVDASIMFSFAREGCVDIPLVHSECGCTNTGFPNFQSYFYFLYSGQAISFYSTSDCQGTPFSLLTSPVLTCDPIKVASIKMECLT